MSTLQFSSISSSFMPKCSLYLIFFITFTILICSRANTNIFHACFCKPCSSVYAHLLCPLYDLLFEYFFKREYNHALFTSMHEYIFQSESDFVLFHPDFSPVFFIREHEHFTLIFFLIHLWSYVFYTCNTFLLTTWKLDFVHSFFLENALFINRVNE